MHIKIHNVKPDWQYTNCNSTWEAEAERPEIQVIPSNIVSLRPGLHEILSQRTNVRAVEMVQQWCLLLSLRS